MNLHVTTVPLDDDRPLLELTPQPAGTVAWVRRGEGLVGWGVAARLEPGAGTSRFVHAEAQLAALAADAQIHDEVEVPGTGLVAFGSFSFDADATSSVLVVPRVVVGRADGRTWLTRVSRPGAAPAPGPATCPPASPPRDRPRFAGSSNPDLRWLEAVADVAARIRRGELEKAVLARDHAVWSHEPFDPVDLARRLTARFPRCHTFIADGLVGATPEMLLQRRGDRISSRVLAGTTGRHDDEVEDAALGAALLDSAKDRLEHELAARSVDEVLRPRTSVLHTDPEPRLLRLDNVQHLATTFSGTLAAPASSLELIGALHPTAAVGGTPREAALAVIRSCEGMDRGRYAAPVGWTDPSGDGDWGIALRCAELSGARARLFAGVGIVGASLPEDELEETRLKLRAMQAVLEEQATA
ncbi:MAG: isochorismate synthase [Nitriliruptoraceae bacterium]|nr:isochorismate synthase [Nitriliruptoraceae bacterium]